MNMKRNFEKLLVIVGPTASGKSALGLVLAKQFSGEIVSADSRQIYKDFDIGTGKEVEALQKGIAKKQTDKWIVEGIPIHLYDIVEGHASFSAVAYAAKARDEIAKLQKEKTLPILVGGTGFYIKATLNGIPNSGLERNEAIRAFLSGKTVSEMQIILHALDPDKLASLNNSDKNNPRRLERHIELATAKAKTIPKEILQMYPYMERHRTALRAPNHALEQLAAIRTPLSADVLQIGLQVPMSVLQQRIHKRVENMITLGLINEVKKLHETGFTDKDPAFHTMGYSEFIPYFKGTSSLAEVKDRIVLHTIQYARRQYTWFKRDKRIVWFDISGINYPKLVETRVKKWYDNNEKS